MIAHADEVPGGWWSVHAVGEDARLKGQVLWWVIPTVYWPGFLATGLGLLLAWIALGWLLRRFGHYPNLRYAFGSILTLLPAFVAGGLALGLSTSKWAQPFLPDSPLAQIPRAPAYALTAFFVALLPAAWIFVRHGRGLAPEVDWESASKSSAAPSAEPPAAEEPAAEEPSP